MEKYSKEKSLEKSYEKAYASALRILGAREHACKELGQKLLKRGFDEETVLKVIDELQDFGYLNDVSFAMSYIKKARRSFKADALIKYELSAKGVSSESAGIAFDEMKVHSVLEEDVELKEPELDRAIFFLKKTVDYIGARTEFAGICKEDKYKEMNRLKAKFARKLAAKGFATSTVVKAVEAVLKDIENE